MSAFVYLIEAQNGLAKIGCASDPAQRLETIRTHCPLLVRLLAQWAGDSADEFALHARFDAYRHHREWFQIDGSFRAFVAKRHGLGLPFVEAWDSLRFQNREERRAASRASQARKQRARWADPKEKLHWLGQMRFGRLEAERKRALGLAPTAYVHFEGLREHAHALTRSTPVGQQLLAEIANAERLATTPVEGTA